MSSDSDESWILYDGDCPFCSNYVALLRLKKAIGEVRLINAREAGPEVEAVRAAQLDLDEGMVFHWQGAMYHGDECMHILSLLSEPKGFIRWLTAWTFKSRKRARVLYPYLRFGRNTTLKLLGRKKIADG